MTDPTTAALEAERRRLAHTLETTLIAQISLTLAQVSAYQKTTTDAGALMAFSVLGSLVRELLQQARDLEASLNPSVLETLGLEAALEGFIRAQTRTSGATIAFYPAHLRQRPPAYVELLLYRALQDALSTRIIDGASSLTLRVTTHDADLICTLSDNVTDDRRAALADRLAAHLTGTGIRVDQDATSLSLHVTLAPPVDLTDRERDVIRCLVEGLTTREIAAALTIQPRTVKFHLDNIYSKLGVSTRTEAAIRALRYGWVRL
jgi:DNA-binding CsgD family transcriptional regulator